MNMGWYYYTLGTTPFLYTTYGSVEFVPMIWGTGSENAISRIAVAINTCWHINEPICQCMMLLKLCRWK